MKPLQNLVVSLVVLALGATALYIAWLVFAHASVWYAALDGTARERLLAAIAVAAAISLAVRWCANARERVRTRRRLRVFYRDALTLAVRGAESGALPAAFPDGAAWLTCGASPSVLTAVRRLRERVATRDDAAPAVTSLALALRRDLGLPTLGLSDAGLRDLLDLDAPDDASHSGARARA